MIFVEKIAHMHWVEARLLSLADQMTQIVVFWPQFPNKLLTLKSCGGQHLVCKKKLVEVSWGSTCGRSAMPKMLMAASRFRTMRALNEASGLAPCALAKCCT